MAKKVIIVGSGIAGLATACRLAAAGHKVEVFEAAPSPGGKLTVIGDDRYRFDAGPSLFTLPHLVDEVIKACGKNPSDYFKYKRKQLACVYYWEDGTRLVAHAEATAFANEVEEKLNVPAAKVLRYLKKSAYVFNYTEKVFLRSSLHKLKTYLNTSTLKSLIRIHKLHLSDTLHGVNRKKLKHPKLVQLFDRFATYNGSSPYLTPGVMTSIPHLEHNVGTFYPKGGMYAIPEALFRLAEDLGVEFHFESRVDKILVDPDSKVRGVHAVGAEHYADLVVSNMDIVPTYRRLLKDQKAPEKTLKQERSSSALIFYWGIKKEFPQLDLHNIFFSDDYEKEFQEIFQNKRVSEDPTVYVNISSKEGEGDAPEGCENWFVMVNVPGNVGQDWDAWIPKIRTMILQKLNRVLGEDLESLIEFEDYLDPRRIEARTSSFQGSLYGAGSNDTFSAFLRHPNFNRNIEGLYFCGGSVHPGGGIPLCLMGAEITANLIAKDYAG